MRHIKLAGKVNGVCIASAVVSYYLVTGFIVLTGGEQRALTNLPLIAINVAVFSILGLVAISTRRIILASFVFPTIWGGWVVGSSVWAGGQPSQWYNFLCIDFGYFVVFGLVLNTMVRAIFHPGHTGSLLKAC